jgi:hypothetical protein
LEPPEGKLLLQPWEGGRPISIRTAASIVCIWTMAHLRDNPFPRAALAPGAGVGPGAQSVRMLVLPHNTQNHRSSPTLPCGWRWSWVDQCRLGLLSMLESLARIVLPFLLALSSVIQHQAVASHEGQEVLFPLAQLSGRWRPPFLLLLCAAALPPSVAWDDRAPLLAALVEHLHTKTMAAVANAPSSLGTFHLSNVLAYSGRGPKEALASLVGEEAARVPGMYGPPSPPVTLPALEQLSITRIAEDLGEDLPYETILELDADVNVLRDACAVAVQASHETREAAANFHTYAMARIAAVEARMPGARSFMALEDLKVFCHSHQGHLEALRAEVRTLQRRLSAGAGTGPDPARGPGRGPPPILSPSWRGVPLAFFRGWGPGPVSHRVPRPAFRPPTPQGSSSRRGPQTPPRRSRMLCSLDSC